MFKVLFIILCVLATFMLIGSVAHISFTHHNKRSMTQVDKSKQIDNSIFLMSVSSWVLIFFGICALNPSEHVLLNTFAMIGFLWPVLLLLSRMAHIRFDEKETGSESHVQHNDTRGSAGLLFTAAFGIGVILTSLKKDASPLGSKLVLLSLLFCVAFLIPTNAFPVESHISHGIRTFQSCMTQIAIGLFIVGISISYFGV